MFEGATTENAYPGDIEDGFTCAKCGLHIEGYVEITDDIKVKPYRPKFCPECGRRIIDNQKIIVKQTYVAPAIELLFFTKGEWLNCDGQ